MSLFSFGIHKITREDENGDNAGNLEIVDKIFKSEVNNNLLYEAIKNELANKRNGLAIKELGLEKYQLLLPIPENAIDMNPNLTQNPGY